MMPEVAPARQAELVSGPGAGAELPLQTGVDRLHPGCHLGGQAAQVAGDTPLETWRAGALRAHAAIAAKQLDKAGVPPNGTQTFNAGWAGLGPNPIVQVQRSSNTFNAVAGRIGALAIRPSNGQFILGGAQGGIWLYNSVTATWSPKTDNQDSLATGALAIAPSNDSIIYDGTGEGALSGDSMYGDGILKSTDGGNTWNHVSGDFFEGVSTSGLAVDPTNPNHLYAAILRGRERGSDDHVCAGDGHDSAPPSTPASDAAANTPPLPALPLHLVVGSRTMRPFIPAGAHASDLARPSSTVRRFAHNTSMSTGRDNACAAAASAKRQYT